MELRDWSSDVCSSDLAHRLAIRTQNSPMAMGLSPLPPGFSSPIKLQSFNSGRCGKPPTSIATPKPHRLQSPVSVCRPSRARTSSHWGPQRLPLVIGAARPEKLLATHGPLPFLLPGQAVTAQTGAKLEALPLYELWVVLMGGPLNTLLLERRSQA